MLRLDGTNLCTIFANSTVVNKQREWKLLAFRTTVKKNCQKNNNNNLFTESNSIFWP